jgi:signal peptidase II
MHGLQAKGRTPLRLRVRPIVRRVLTIAWLVWALDVVSKTLAQHFLEGRESKKILGSFLKLNFAQNSGAAFSFASNGSVFLGSFSILAIFAVAYWAPRLTSRGWGSVLGLVLGGALGNLSDRIFRSHAGLLKGQVIDWIQLPSWPIFNLADSAIVIAALIAVILSFRNVLPISKPPLDGGEKGLPDA